MIQLNQVTKVYKSDDLSNKILDHVSLIIEDGDMMSIMGPSGAGKTTLMNLIGGMDSVTEGEISVNGMNLSEMTKDQLSHLRNRTMGYVFQRFNLIEQYTVLENLMIPMIIYNKNCKRNDRKSRAEMNHISMNLLEKMNMEKYAQKKPGKLSGGQQQRVAIARALVNQPDIILADEPTGALDRKNGEEIINILKKLNAEGRTILIVTHDANVASSCKKHIEILDGKIHS